MRYLFSLIVAVVIAGALFLIMRGFIEGKSTASSRNRTAQLVNFVNEPKHEQVQTKKHEPPPKPKQPKVPKAAPKIQVQTKAVQVPNVNINVPNLNVPGIGGGTGPFIGSFSSDYLNQNGEAIPIVPIQPSYPVQAQLNGIEGTVTLEFTIQPDGTAANPEVIAAKPPRVFNSAAIQALLRSKFKPKVVNGKAMPVRAKFTYVFKLPKGNGG